jgi:hypothetical protein
MNARRPDDCCPGGHDVDEVAVLGGVLGDVVRAAISAEREHERGQVVGEAAVVDAVLEQCVPDEHVEDEFGPGRAELAAGQQRVERARVVEDRVEAGSRSRASSLSRAGSAPRVSSQMMKLASARSNEPRMCGNDHRFLLLPPDANGRPYAAASAAA